MRPEKWGDSQVGFRRSNASGGRIVLLPGAFWAHGASKMAILGAPLLLCIYSVSEFWRACFRQARVARAVLPPGALFRARAFALPPRPQIPHAPTPTFGGITEKGGLSLRGDSRHDRNRHHCRNRHTCQNRHGCLMVLYFVVGQAKGE